MNSADNSFIIHYKYPQTKKFPAGIKKNFFWKLKIVFFFLLFTAASCKTCNCPAYSYKPGINLPLDTINQPDKIGITVTQNNKT
jgi:hypothetical protein